MVEPTDNDSYNVYITMSGRDGWAILTLQLRLGGDRGIFAADSSSTECNGIHKSIDSSGQLYRFWRSDLPTGAYGAAACTNTTRGI